MGVRGKVGQSGVRLTWQIKGCNMWFWCVGVCIDPWFECWVSQFIYLIKLSTINRVKMINTHNFSSLVHRVNFIQFNPMVKNIEECVRDWKVGCKTCSVNWIELQFWRKTSSTWDDIMQYTKSIMRWNMGNIRPVAVYDWLQMPPTMKYTVQYEKSLFILDPTRKCDRLAIYMMQRKQIVECNLKQKKHNEQ